MAAGDNFIVRGFGSAWGKMPRWGCVSILGALLFLGALAWAVERDPFERIWFRVRGADGSKTECVAIRSKAGPPSPPLVCYLQGWGESLPVTGDHLRQISEMGLVTVAIQYDQTNTPVFEAQFAALLAHAKRQPWADPGCMSWVGYGLGSDRLLGFALAHPSLQPKLLILAADVWAPEIDELIAAAGTVPLPASGSAPSKMSVVLVHLISPLGHQREEALRLAQAQEVAARLQASGVPASLTIMRGDVIGREGDRVLLSRACGECCLKWARGPDALGGYRSISAWRARAAPLWACEVPAVAWAVLWFWAARTTRPRPVGPPPPVLTKSARSGRRRGKAEAQETGLTGLQVALRCAAAILASAALGQIALHVGLPALPSNPLALRMARQHLLPFDQRADFDLLVPDALRQTGKVGVLLEYVGLASYNRHLVEWRVGDQAYRDFVLSPRIASQFDGDLGWRRPLWESLYPRVRKAQNPIAAAAMVVRHLRERVTTREADGPPATIAQIWERQLTGQRGFEALYVAALRSVGVPARLGPQGLAELHDGVAWMPAPRPVLGAL